MELVNQWLAQLDVAPIVGALLIAAVTIVAACVVRLLGRKIALALSRWSGLGISTQLFDIIRVPLWISVVLLGTLIEVTWLTPPAHIDFLIAGTAKTLLAIIWMVVLGKTLKLSSSRLSGYYPGASEFFRLTENIGIAVIAVVGGLMVLAVWQINLTPLLASAGLAGIVVALAAKDTLGNFFGGISVFLDHPFKLGDYIILNSGERGEVVHIGLRSTRIRTRDDVLITIPNSVIVSTKIINESAPARIMRVRTKISVMQGSDVDKVQETLLKIAKDNRLVLSEPRPRIRFRGFGDTSFDFELLCWIANPKNKGRLIHQLNTAVVKEFNQSGINLVTPQRELFVYRVSNLGTVPKEEQPHSVEDADQIEQAVKTPITPVAKKQAEQGTEGPGVSAA